MALKVYKFGGASVATPDLVRNLQQIVELSELPLVLVISAIGKTTNKMEAIVEAYWEDDAATAQQLLHELEVFHLEYAQSLFGGQVPADLQAQFDSFLTDVDWVLTEERTQSYDYYYDQIVPFGELMSTAIVAAFLSDDNDAVWLDARDVLRSDRRFRDARIDWDYSQRASAQKIKPLVEAGKLVVTQGFIASTDQNESTTLGREGSDYTASLLGAFLQAQDVTIWKDVPGLLNADPRLSSDTVLIPEISYTEVVEMAYYGAQVIHPKTIKPLFVADIPMYVRSFIDYTAPGTKISVDGVPIETLPPLTVVKTHQLWVKFTTRDFSFFDESYLSRVYGAFDVLGIKQNLTHISAISLDVVIDHKREIIAKIEEALSEVFVIRFRENKKLTTVRHYTTDHLSLVEDQRFDLVERTPRTLQFLQEETV